MFRLMQLSILVYWLANWTKSNILINSEGKACVADFGMLKIVAEFQARHISHCQLEALFGELHQSSIVFYKDHTFPVITAECDVYSYESLTLQVYIRLYVPQDI